MAEGIIELNDTNFEQEIKDKEIAVVDFWAVWCGPCQMFVSIFEQFAKENPDVYCAKVNVDDAKEISGKYSIMSIPTIMFLKKGKVIKQQAGVLPVDVLKQMVDEIK